MIGIMSTDENMPNGLELENDRLESEAGEEAPHLRTSRPALMQLSAATFSCYISTPLLH